MSTISKLKEYTTRDGKDVLIYELFGDDPPYVHGAYRDSDGKWVPTTWTINGVHELSGDPRMNLMSRYDGAETNTVYLQEFISYQESQTIRLGDLHNEITNLRDSFNNLTHLSVSNGKGIARHESEIVNLINITNKNSKAQVVVAILWIVFLLIAISILGK